MKTIYIIWYESDYAEGACFEGKNTFWTTDYNKALDFKIELEEHAVNLGEDAKYSVVSFEVKD